tara:strand:- start:88 stop:288 length:201 start_codon:yes stop_codon:yes gene_type:complete
MSHEVNDRVKESWFEEALDYGLSSPDAENYVDWQMDIRGFGTVADYVNQYLRDDLAPRGVIINIKT